VCAQQSHFVGAAADSTELNPVERRLAYLRSSLPRQLVLSSMADIMEACGEMAERVANNQAGAARLCAVAWAFGSAASVGLTLLANRGCDRKYTQVWNIRRSVYIIIIPVSDCGALLSPSNEGEERSQ